MLVYILCVVICLVTDTEQSQWSDWQMRRSRAVTGDFGAGTHTVPCHSSIIFYYPTQPNHHTTLALHWLFYDDWVSRCTGLFETQIFTKPQWKWPYINQPHTHSFLSLMWNAVKETHKPCPQLHSLRSNISTCLEAAENVPLALNLKQFAAIHNILLRTAQ